MKNLIIVLIGLALAMFLFSITMMVLLRLYHATTEVEVLKYGFIGLIIAVSASYNSIKRS